MGKKILVYTSLFPSKTQPVKGLFVSELVNALSEKIAVQVVRPVLLNQQWSKVWQECGSYNYKETIIVLSPMCVNIPKFFKFTDACLMAQFSRKAFKRSITPDTCLVHAHFAYPDAVAAWRLSKEMNLPFVVTIHGSDINILAKDPLRKKQIVRMLNHADAVICVSEELIQKAKNIGVQNKNMFHIPNGVDTEKFYPGDKKAAKKNISAGHIEKMILTVGNLVPIKGYDNLIQALAQLPREIGLVMAGTGPEKENLQNLIQKRNLQDRVIFAGAVDHNHLVPYYQAADYLMISSHSEGWPTVIFEAFACGLPVLANNVGGISEAVCSDELGLLMDNNHPQTIFQTIVSAYQRKWNHKHIVSVAQQFSWSKIADQTLDVFHAVSGPCCHVNEIST